MAEVPKKRRSIFDAVPKKKENSFRASPGPESVEEDYSGVKMQVGEEGGTYEPLRIGASKAGKAELKREAEEKKKQELENVRAEIAAEESMKKRRL